MHSSKNKKKNKKTFILKNFGRAKKIFATIITCVPREYHCCKNFLTCVGKSSYTKKFFFQSKNTFTCGKYKFGIYLFFLYFLWITKPLGSYPAWLGLSWPSYGKPRGDFDAWKSARTVDTSPSASSTSSFVKGRARWYRETHWRCKRALDFRRKPGTICVLGARSRREEYAIIRGKQIYRAILKSIRGKVRSSSTLCR